MAAPSACRAPEVQTGVPQLLTLAQWLSPAFPTGAFAYSHGLEQVIADGGVSDAATLGAWLTDVLRFGAGWQDAVLLNMALAPAADHGALNQLARALQPCAERLTETTEQGIAFARVIGAIRGENAPPHCLPVALGAAAASLQLPPVLVIAFFLQAFAGNLVIIATRHLPLGQSAGQRVIASLVPVIHDLALRAARAGEADLTSAALGADLAAIQHETKDVRVFRT